MNKRERSDGNNHKQRAVPFHPGLFAILVLTFLLAVPADGAVLANPDFETGNLSGWTSVGNPLTVGIDTNNTFNGNCSAHLYGSYSSATLITNSISQRVSVMNGDNIQVLGFANWKTQTKDLAAATGYVQAALSGAFTTTSAVWYATNSWCFFDLRAKLFGISDNGFESGAMDQWTVRCDDLIPSVQSAVVDSGNYAFRMRGSLRGGPGTRRPSSSP